MKLYSYRLLYSVVILMAFILYSGSASAANPPKREFRAAWVSTVYCLDWPTNGSGGALQGNTLTIMSQQKTRLRTIFSTLKNQRFNAIFFQVRPMSDALYNSSIEPSSSYLTGTRGAKAIWDPLAVAIETAHSMGMELHAWVNPYRWAGSATVDWNTPWDKKVKDAGWILTTEKGKILNPGIQAVEDHIVTVCREIITKYDVDGLVFDDYFYNSGTPEDATAGDYTTYKDSHTTMSIANWRRDNVNRMVAAVYNMVQEEKPYIRFGISPAGVAKGGAAAVGLTPFSSASDWQYAGIYSDPLAWLAAGNVDYLSPQLYWKTDHKTNPFGPLANWWSNAAKKFNRHFYASNSVSFLGSSNTTDDWAEIAKQIYYSRIYTRNNAAGIVVFRVGFINGPNASGLGNYLRNNTFTTFALPPQITWKSQEEEPSPVTGVEYKNGRLSWEVSEDTTLRYSVYAIPDSIEYANAMDKKGDGIDARYLLGMAYSGSITIPSSSRTGRYVVCPLDAYGKEYTPSNITLDGVKLMMTHDFDMAFNSLSRTIKFSDEARMVMIYQLSGQRLATYNHVTEVSLNFNPGLYIVKAMSTTGETITKKIILK